jgi:hypothetical protein
MGGCGYRQERQGAHHGWCRGRPREERERSTATARRGSRVTVGPHDGRAADERSRDARGGGWR